MIGFMPQVQCGIARTCRSGPRVGSSAESGITLDNSVKGLALSHIEDKVVAKKRKSRINQSYATTS